MALKKRISRIIRVLLPPTVLSYFIGLRLYLRPRKHSYSQRGEDLIINSYFRKSAVKRDGIETGIYLDIGAWHPKCISNTALMHENGWRGYAVDIDYYKLRFMKFARNERVGIIHAAVSNVKSDATNVYRFGIQGDWSDIDTLDKKSADFAVENWGVGPYRIEQINSIEINDLLSELPHINFLNIDIEGLDGSVIAALDLKRFPIDVILYEDNTGEHFEKINKNFIEHGYKLLLNCHGAVAFGKIYPSFAQKYS